MADCTCKQTVDGTITCLRCEVKRLEESPFTQKLPSSMGVRDKVQTGYAGLSRKPHVKDVYSKESH